MLLGGQTHGLGVKTMHEAKTILEGYYRTQIISLIEEPLLGRNDDSHECVLLHGRRSTVCSMNYSPKKGTRRHLLLFDSVRLRVVLVRRPYQVHRSSIEQSENRTIEQSNAVTAQEELFLERWRYDPFFNVFVSSCQ